MAAFRNLMKAPLRGLFLLLLAAQVVARAPLGDEAIASAHPLATEAGIEILRAGGNAFDAAVAVSAALAVVEPYSSGLGGGGFWLLHLAASGRDVMIDGREKAPLAAHRDMYLNERGEVVPQASIDGPLAAGIPGEPAALAYIARRYGRLPLKRSLAPAIRLAEQGFPVDTIYRRMAGWRRSVLARYPMAAKVFLEKGGIPAIGARIRQPELAATLGRLARFGRNGFYAGPVAHELVRAVRAAGGIWRFADLARYRVVEREPVKGEFMGWKITSAALPSSGGIVLVEMLNMLEAAGWAERPPMRSLTLMIEAMRRAYRDRALYLGDSDFVDIPLKKLLSKAHARRLIADYDPGHATPSQPMATQREGHHTTHFSIVDRDGNRVGATLSINYPFGSGFVAGGTGVLLNDEMDDFSAKPGVPNVYGLVGNQANAIAPGKRMLSSMSPTFVETPHGVAVLGTPGGSRIITMLLQAVLAMRDSREPADWVARPRIHHQYLPDQVQFEPGALSANQRKALSERGYVLKAESRPWGNMQAVRIDKSDGRASAASDPRGIGASQVIRAKASAPR